MQVDLPLPLQMCFHVSQIKNDGAMCGGIREFASHGRFPNVKSRTAVCETRHAADDSGRCDAVACRPPLVYLQATWLATLRKTTRLSASGERIPFPSNSQQTHLRSQCSVPQVSRSIFADLAGLLVAFVWDLASTLTSLS